MKTELEIGERLALTQIFPREGNFLTLRIVKKITEKLSLTEQEIKDWGIKSFETSPGVTSFTWEPSKVQAVGIDFSDAEADLIRVELKKLDTGNRLNFSNLSAFEKFCT